jgi:hypothetical protein
MDMSVSFHKLLKQYLCSGLNMSSEFFNGFLTPKKRAKTPWAVGYMEVDRACRPSPIVVSDIADFFRRVWVGTCVCPIKRNALDRASCGTIGQLIAAFCRFPFHRQSDPSCRQPV